MTEKDDKAGKLIGWSIGTGLDKKELENLVDLPCVYTFKVIGVSHTPYQKELLALVEAKLGRPLEPSETAIRMSGAGKYVSITLKLPMTTLEEIYEIYALLKGHPATKFLL